MIRTLLVLCLLLGGGYYLVTDLRPWDPHLSADEVEREWSERTKIDQEQIECEPRNDNDGSIPLDDIDYECRVGEPGRKVWIGTDSEGITETAGEGP